jgi:hypothetical protein
VGIIVEDDDWYAPLLFGVDDENEAKAIAYSYVDNALTMAGGEYTFMDITRMFNPNELQEQFDAIVFLSSTVEGLFQVQDVEVVQQILKQGYGKGKAYGCGLLTFA